MRGWFIAMGMAFVSPALVQAQDQNKGAIVWRAWKDKPGDIKILGTSFEFRQKIARSYFTGENPSPLFHVPRENYFELNPENSVYESDIDEDVSFQEVFRNLLQKMKDQSNPKIFIDIIAHGLRDSIGHIYFEDLAQVIGKEMDSVFPEIEKRPEIWFVVESCESGGAFSYFQESTNQSFFPIRIFAASRADENYMYLGTSLMRKIAGSADEEKINWAEFLNSDSDYNHFQFWSNFEPELYEDALSRLPASSSEANSDIADFLSQNLPFFERAVPLLVVASTYGQETSRKRILDVLLRYAKVEGLKSSAAFLRDQSINASTRELRLLYAALFMRTEFTSQKFEENFLKDFRWATNEEYLSFTKNLPSNSRHPSLIKAYIATLRAHRIRHTYVDTQIQLHLLNQLYESDRSLWGTLTVGRPWGLKIIDRIEAAIGR